MKRVVASSLLESVWLRVGLRSSLGLFFVVSSLLKLADFPAFTEHVGDFGIVLDSLVTPTALMICVAEVVFGAGLILGRGWALTGVTLLLLLFLAILGYAMWLGLDIECGCLGSSFSLSLRSQFVVDVVLLAVCGFLFRNRPDFRTQSSGRR